MCHKFGLHTMRRTYCTGLIRGWSETIKTVQQWMGHADIETTLIYQKHVDARSKQGTKTANSIDFGDFSPKTQKKDPASDVLEAGCFHCWDHFRTLTLCFRRKRAE